MTEDTRAHRAKVNEDAEKILFSWMHEMPSRRARLANASDEVKARLRQIVIERRL